MALQYLVSGSKTLAAAGWVGAAGFGAAATLVIPDGNQIIDTAVDRSGDAASLSLEVARPFSGFGGSSSAPIKFSVTDASAAEKTSANTEAFFKYLASGGQFFIAAVGTTSGTNSIDNVFQNSPGATLNLVSGLFVHSHLERGTYKAFADAVLTNFEAWGGQSDIPAQTSATNLTSVVIYDGTHNIRRPSTAITQYGGTVNYDYEGATATGTYTQIGGTFNHIAGDITTHVHGGGLHDNRNMRRGSTITTCTRKPLSKFVGTRSGGLLTITNDINIGFITL